MCVRTQRRGAFESTKSGLGHLKDKTKTTACVIHYLRFLCRSAPKEFTCRCDALESTKSELGNLKDKLLGSSENKDESSPAEVHSSLQEVLELFICF